MTQILSYLTMYSFLDTQQEKPYGIRLWGETIQTFWFATYQERNAVANTLAAIGVQNQEQREAMAVVKHLGLHTH